MKDKLNEVDKMKKRNDVLEAYEGNKSNEAENQIQTE